jgi:hypothetical protein
MSEEGERVLRGRMAMGTVPRGGMLSTNEE